ncbi:hypothetical protein [Aeromonas sp. S9(2024)]|uniref:hypothetical protein n=1 Tax=Aeromonas TaxID=642 RepID=UPI0035275E81
MSIKSTPEGYLVDIRPQGREGKRIRKRFKTKSEAQQFERWVIATEHNKEWVDRLADYRPLSELIELWWRYHGQTAESGGGGAQETPQYRCSSAPPVGEASDPCTVLRVSGTGSTLVVSPRR